MRPATHRLRSVRVVQIKFFPRVRIKKDTRDTRDTGRCLFSVSYRRVSPGKSGKSDRNLPVGGRNGIKRSVWRSELDWYGPDAQRRPAGRHPPLRPDTAHPARRPPVPPAHSARRRSRRLRPDRLAGRAEKVEVRGCPTGRGLATSPPGRVQIQHLVQIALRSPGRAASYVPDPSVCLAERRSTLHRPESTRRQTSATVTSCRRTRASKNRSRALTACRKRLGRLSPSSTS